MKRLLFSLTLALCSATIAMAQAPAVQKPAQVQAATVSATKAENMVFDKDSHEFGVVAEGPAAQCEFHFKNTGKEPILIERVQPSCGCTTPSYSKDPVLPGKEGIISASYSTAGRPGAFTKTITVVSNAGTKVLTIKGEVEKAPTSSVPENTSMLKTN